MNQMTVGSTYVVGMRDGEEVECHGIPSPDVFVIEGVEQNLLVVVIDGQRRGAFRNWQYYYRKQGC